jgi:hypothetical protein
MRNFLVIASSDFLPTQRQLASEFPKMDSITLGPLGPDFAEGLVAAKESRQEKLVNTWCKIDPIFQSMFYVTASKSAQLKLAQMLQNEANYLKNSEGLEGSDAISILNDTYTLFRNLYENDIDFEVAETARDSFYIYNKDKKVCQYITQPHLSKLFTPEFIRYSKRQRGWFQRYTAVILVPIVFKKTSLHQTGYETYGDFIASYSGDYLGMDELSPIWSKI